MNLGRHQLLNWVNSIVQSEYPTIESLCDGIGYCQIFEAAHPGSINITRMNMQTKLPIDCLKNIKLLENAMKNMKITMTVSVDKLANGKFQDNIIFVQWMYTHCLKYGAEQIQNYMAFNRRVQILEKQGKNWDEMNAHLLPNEAYLQQDQNRGHNEDAVNENLEVDDKVQQISNYITQLEVDLKEKMQLNWRIMHIIGKSIDERNILYSTLEQIQKTVIGAADSPVKKQLLRILYENQDGTGSGYRV